MATDRVRAFGQHRTWRPHRQSRRAPGPARATKCVWNLEHDGRLMSPRCQRISCRKWMSWERKVSRRQDQRGVWLLPK